VQPPRAKEKFREDAEWRPSVCTQRQRYAMMSTLASKSIPRAYEKRKSRAPSLHSRAFVGGKRLVSKQPFASKQRAARLCVRAEKVVGIDLGTTNSAVSVIIRPRRFMC
jgi:hypothetical protein